MKNKQAYNAYHYAWDLRNDDKVRASKKRSHAKKRIKAIKEKRACWSRPLPTQARRFDMWKKFKSGQLAPDIAARVAKDYAKEFAEFEAESQKLKPV